METRVESKPVQQTLEMVVTRADGRVENLGVVGHWHRNPLRRIQFRVTRLLKRIIK